MQNKYIFSMLAAAGLLLAASCTNDELNSSEPGGEATVRFSIGLENGVQTRTISDGKGVDMLVYAVYDANGKVISSIDGETENKPVELVSTDEDQVFTNLTANVDITLVKGQTYKVVFWAQNSNCKAYTYDDNMNITVSYKDLDATAQDDAANNDETRDAFYAVETITVDGSDTKKVTLKRPFAQINVGVTSEDWTAAGNLGVEIASSAVTIENAGNSINLLTGAVSGTEKVTFNSAAIPGGDDGETLTVTSDDETTNSYYWLSMSYILVNDGSEDGSTRTTLDNLKFTFDPADGADSDITLELSGVSVQRNYRTNIVGKILTGNVSFTVILDKTYGNGTDSGEENIELWDGKTTTEPETSEDGNTIYISTGSELAWLAAQVNSGTTSGTTSITKSGNSISGKTIQLTKDIYLNNQPWTPIGTLPDGKNVKDNQGDYATYGFEGTFNGNGHTIYGLKASSNNATGLFGAVYGNVIIKNVIVDGAAITSNHYAGVIAGYYNANADGMSLKIDSCTVKNSSVTVSVETLSDGSYDNGDKAGGIIGHSAGYGRTVSITNCSVESTSISAYRDLGGIIGNATCTSGTETTISGNSVKDITLNVDLSTTYTIDTGYNPGAILGRNDNGIDVTTNNSYESVSINMINAGDAANVISALEDENVESVTIAKNMTVDLTSSNTSATAISLAEDTEVTINLNGNSLTADQIDVSEGADLVIKGSDADSEQLILTTSINASSNSSVSVEGVTVTSEENGIYSDDEETNVTVSITDSEITAVQYGVALRGSECDLTIDGTTITSTSDEEGNYGYGVLLRGDDSALTITNSSVSTNSPAEEDDNTGYYPQAYGIVAYGDNSKATIEEVTITTTGYGSHGVYAAGDGSEMIVSNTEITTSGQNSAGVYIAKKYSCDVTLDNVTINTTGDRARGVWTEGSDAELIIKESTITATGDGVYSYDTTNKNSENVIITITDSGITVNNDGNSSVSGVGLYSNTSTLTMSGSTVTMSEENAAATTTGVTSQGSNNTVSLDNTKVTSNGATNAYGVFIRATENQVSITNGSAVSATALSATSGGAYGIYLHSVATSSTVTLDNTTVISNGAYNAYGAYIAGAEAQVSITGSSSVSATATSKVAYTICLAAAATDSAVTIDGTAITSTAGTNSRGVYILSGASNATVKMTSSSITSTGGNNAYGIHVGESTAHATIDSATANAITATTKYSSRVTVTD